MSTELRDVLQLCDRLRKIVLQLREDSQVMLSPVKHAHGGYWVHPSQEQHIWKLVDACAPDMLECLDLLDRSSGLSKDLCLKGRDLRRHLERRDDAPDALRWIGTTQDMVDELDSLLRASQHDTLAEAATNTPTDQVGDGDDGSAPTHSEDFTSVKWYGTRYTFTKGNQAESVQTLWEAWEQGGHTLSQETIRERINSADDHFQLAKVFRQHRKSGGYEKHPAWGTMIQQETKGTYRLVPPESHDSHENP